MIAQYIVADVPIIIVVSGVKGNTGDFCADCSCCSIYAEMAIRMLVGRCWQCVRVRARMVG